MTETEWLNGTRPGPMLVFLAGRGYQRELSLFRRHCLLRLAKLCPAQASETKQERSIVSLAQAVAMAAWRSAGAASGDVLAAAAGDFGWSAANDAAHAAEEEAQVELLRHLIGNPFQVSPFTASA